MFRNLSVIAAFCGLLVAGCRDNNNEGPFMAVDLSASPGDMGTTGNTHNPDLSGKSYTSATIHDIDTGTVTTSTAVHITGAVATTIVDYFKAKSKTLCRYQVFVQDPACTTPPCGLVVQADGPAVTNNTCPSAAQSGTVLATVDTGSVLDIMGTTDAFSNHSPADAGVSGNTVQHSIGADQVTVTATKQALPAAVVIGSTDQAKFIPYGSGFTMYEGMLVKLTDVTVASTDMYGNFTACPGTAMTCASPAGFGGDFDFLYRYALGGDAGQYPTTNTHFASITGVVNSVFAGTVVPTGKYDFAQ
jgi:hypothetical protein